MKRRKFLSALAALPVIVGAGASDPRKGNLLAQAGPAAADPVEKMTAPDWPTIALSHLGFRPKVGSKVLVVRVAHTPLPR